jgi:hypothetical protein
MSENQNELKFLELLAKNIFTVAEDGSIYRTRCRLCGSESLLKVNIFLDSGGKYYSMKFSHEGKRYKVSVHRAVYMFFYGEIPDGMQINHKDGNKLNNAISNLELVTPKDNILHAIYETKTLRCFGMENLKRRLTPPDIARILYYRQLHGYTLKRIAEMFGVSCSRILKICRFTTWRDLLEKGDEKYRAQKTCGSTRSLSLSK